MPYRVARMNRSNKDTMSMYACRIVSLAVADPLSTITAVHVVHVTNCLETHEGERVTLTALHGCADR